MPLGDMNLVKKTHTQLEGEMLRTWSRSLQSVHLHANSKSFRLLSTHNENSDAEYGIVYSKGAGVMGALGLGDSLNDVGNFQRVHIRSSHSSENSPVKVVACGWGHSAAVTASGKLYVFGRPYDFNNLLRINRIRSINPSLGRFVGRFTNWFGSSTSDDGLYTRPMPIHISNNMSNDNDSNSNHDKCVDVRCSAGLTIALTDQGDLYSFGLNRWGQCGVDQSTTMIGNSRNKHGIHVFVPTKILFPGSDDNRNNINNKNYSNDSDSDIGSDSGSGSKVISYDIGLQHGIAVCENGKVYTWGKGTRGQLGDGKNDTSATPVLPALYSMNDIEKYKMIIKNRAVEKSSASAVADVSDVLKESLDGMEGMIGKPIQVAAGFAHTSVLTSKGEIYLWGKGMSLVPKGTAKGDDPNIGGYTGSGPRFGPPGPGGGGSPTFQSPSSTDTPIPTPTLVPVPDARSSHHPSSLSVITYEDQLRPRRVLLPNNRIPIEIVCSNFTLACRDNLGGLWALGMGEYDRNTNPYFLPVQQAITLTKSPNEPNASSSDNDSVSENESDDERDRERDPKENGDGRGHPQSAHVVMAPDVKLRKGYQRVSVIPPNPNPSSDDSNSRNIDGLAEYSYEYAKNNSANVNSNVVAFELVLHQGEAFLQQIENLNIESNNSSGVSSDVGLVDYSTGWQHSLAVFR